MEKVVRCFLKDDKWKYLLVKHQWKNFWSLPGGHIEKNESLYEAIGREIKEELNLEVENILEIMWLNVENLDEEPTPICNYRINFVNNEKKQIERLEYIFLLRIKSWNIEIQEKEILEVDFFTKEEILNSKYIYTQIKEILKKID